MRRALLLAPLAVLVMTACGGGDDDAGADPTAPPAGTDAPTTVPGETGPGSTPTSSAPAGSLRPSASSVVQVPSSTPPSTTPSDPTGNPLAAEAVTDLATREGVEESAITVVSAEDVTWRSGAIGCPRPGMGYTQALVPGTRVVLEIGAERFEYHAGGGRSIFLCEDPESPVDG